MTYRILATPRFEKDVRKLDHYTAKMLKVWITKNLQNCENPRLHGKALTGDHAGKWRYRIGDYRLLCHIQDDKLVILALTVGHRRDVYD